MAVSESGSEGAGRRLVGDTESESTPDEAVVAIGVAPIVAVAVVVVACLRREAGMPTLMPVATAG